MIEIPVIMDVKKVDGKAMIGDSTTIFHINHYHIRNHIS